MGLFVIRARFVNEPPSERAFRRELSAELGSADGLDSYSCDGSTVEIATVLDEVTLAYATKVLLRLGGECIDRRTQSPLSPHLPSFVEKPWLEWPWWKRAGIRLRFLLGLLSTALPSASRS